MEQDRAPAVLPDHRQLARPSADHLPDHREPSNTTTRTGLVVQCELDPNIYPTKIKLTDQQKKAIPIERHKFHGEWNYTIKPSPNK